MGHWKKIDLAETIPFYLTRGEDECYYAREYISGGGYKASQTNGLISNFKKGVDKRNTFQWQYKQQAIYQFATELSPLLRDGAVLAPIPSSKCKTDSDYDSRLEDMLKALARIRPQLKIIEPITIRSTSQAAHLGGERDIQVIYDNLVWQDGVPQGATSILLVDDVITTGAHFKACKRLLREQVQDIRVIGVFWAKTIWVNDHPELKLDPPT